MNEKIINVVQVKKKEQNCSVLTKTQLKKELTHTQYQLNQYIHLNNNILPSLRLTQPTMLMSFKNKNIVRGFPFFSHFACLPLIQESYRQYLLKTQQLVQQKLTQYGFNVQQTVRRHSHLLGHLTLFMVTLRGEATKNKLKQVLEQSRAFIEEKLNHLPIYPSQVKYFTRQNKNEKCRELTVVYLEIDEQANEVLIGVVDYLVRALLKHEILVAQELKPMRIVYNHKSGRFEPQTFHISLFRCKNLMQRQNILKVFEQVNTQLFQNKQIKFECKLLDVSTMMAFDTTEFYEPFTRMVFGHNQLKIQHEKKQQISVTQKQQVIVQE